MGKSISKQFLYIIFSIIFYTQSFFAADYLTILVKINPAIPKKSYSKLTKKYIKIKDLRSKNIYLTNLDSLLNETYKRFYPSVWSNVNIFEVIEPHFTLAIAGTIATKNNKEYVLSNDGKKVVPLQKAITAIETAVKNNTQYYKKMFGDKYKNKVGFNLKQGAEFLYNPSDTKAKNVFVVQKLSFGKPGLKHRLYTLATEVTNELAKIGLNPKFQSFDPHISLANFASRDCKIINKLKDLEKNKKSGLSKIFRSVSKTKTGKNTRYYFNKILISKGSLKNNVTLKMLDLK